VRECDNSGMCDEGTRDYIAQRRNDVYDNLSNVDILDEIQHAETLDEFEAAVMAARGLGDLGPAMLVNATEQQIKGNTEVVQEIANICYNYAQGMVGGVGCSKYTEILTLIETPPSEVPPATEVEIPEVFQKTPEELLDAIANATNTNE